MYLPFILNNMNQTFESIPIKSKHYSHNEFMTTYVITMYIIFIIWFILLFLYDSIVNYLRNKKIKKNE